MMKKVIFGVGFILLMLVVFFLPVEKEKEPSKQVKIVNTTETTDFSLSESDSKAFSEERTRDTVSETTESSVKEMQVNNKELLQSFGEAYANYSSIDDRNEKLKKLMTAECIKKNGIDVKTAVQLSSEGSVLDIYQSSDNKYAIVLNCKQNGMNIKVLLLVGVENRKVSEMTYNTIKQEY
ncbi:EF0163 family protein [Enterococcus faecalis]|uniref:EF0163 family protein n=1 Tax=Enterococcus faecalis TaxID=1351 RepID=UPI00045B2AEC|nr:EF0163 family protein [Enterococcus faecalis]KAJ82608.1 putative lipoprotein [Enterococcus faecalis NY9]